MRVLIVEDEVIAAQRLTDMLREKDRDIQVVSILDSVEAAVAYFKHPNDLDLIFMDIELGDGQSFDIFDKVPVNVPVIFITAYQEHTLKAFKQNSVDYLLKPLNKTELEAAIFKYKRIHGQSKTHLQKDILDYLAGASVQGRGIYKNRFLAKTGTRLISEPVENIAYFYTKNKIQYIKTNTDANLTIDKRLDEIESEIDAKTFFRANRQFIINYNNIEKVHAWFSGKLKVQVRPAPYEEIIVSRIKAPQFKKWLGE